MKTGIEKKEMSNFSRILVHLNVEFDLEKKKILLICILFIFMGLTAVALQALLPEILELTGIDILGLPDPSLEAVFFDFWGDISLLALIIVLISMTAFSSEIDVNKQAYINLSRPISRSTYFLSRSLIKTLGVFLGFFIASIITYLYSLAFFDMTDFGNFFYSAVLVSLSLSTIVTVVCMCSSMFSTMTTGIIGFLFIFGQIFIVIIEPIKWIVPLGASSIWIEIFTGNTTELLDIVFSIGSLIAWIVLPLLLGWYYYNNRDL